MNAELLGQHEMLDDVGDIAPSDLLSHRGLDL